MTILIIEDNERLAANLRELLQLEGHAVAVAHDGEEGLRRAVSERFECIILDLNLPKMDGLEVCRRLREDVCVVPVPILMLTARGSKKDVVTGLDMGADDYLAKPFDIEELLARVRTLLRRAAPERSPVLCSGDVALDAKTHEVLKDGRPVRLAPREYALLEHLLRNKGVVQDRLTLLEQVWGESDALLFSQTVDVHVSYLRRKLGRDLVTTVPGGGYLIPDD
jgi:two-component system, OmpR family, response regulator